MNITFDNSIYVLVPSLLVTVAGLIVVKGGKHGGFTAAPAKGKSKDNKENGDTEKAIPLPVAIARGDKSVFAKITLTEGELIDERLRPLIGLDKEIDLWRLVKFWKGGNLVELDIERMAGLWRDSELVAANYIPQLSDMRAYDFFEKRISNGMYFSHFPVQRVLCAKLIEMLDNYGGARASSVVQVTGDPEHMWAGSNIYQILSRVSLLEHTLNVAEKIIDLMTQAKSRFALADALVAALAHDIGKLPKYKDNLYVTGEHPLFSAEVLSGFKEFSMLPKKADILNAIKFHHKGAEGMGLIPELLRKADQQARQQEIEAVTQKSGTKQTAAPADVYWEAPAKDIVLAAIEKEQGGDKAAPSRVPDTARLSLPIPADHPTTEPAQPSPSTASLSTVPPPTPAAEEPIGVLGDIDPAAPMMEGYGVDFETGEIMTPVEYHVPRQMDERPDPQAVDSFMAGVTGGARTIGLRPGDSIIHRVTGTSRPVDTTMAASASRQAHQDIYGDNQTGGNEPQDKDINVNIAQWFNANAFIEALKPHVNALDKEGRFYGFSQTNGYVYFHVGFITKQIKALADKAGAAEIMMLAEGDPKMKQVMKSMAGVLWQRENTLAKGLMKEGYYGSYFEISLRKGGKTSKGFLLPFHAEAFGSIAEMEHSKPEKVRNVMNVKPVTNKSF